MENFSKDEIIDLLKDDSQNDQLFSLADKIRKEYTGDKVHLRKSGVYFDDYIQNIRPITPKEDCEHLLTDLEKICGERVKKLNPETMYYYNVALLKILNH